MFPFNSSFDKEYRKIRDIISKDFVPIIAFGDEGHLLVHKEILFRLIKDSPTTVVLDGNVSPCPLVFHLSSISESEVKCLKTIENTYVNGCKNLSLVREKLARNEILKRKRFLALVNLQEPLETLIDRFSPLCSILYVFRQNATVIPQKTIKIVGVLHDLELLTLLFQSEEEGLRKNDSLLKLKQKKRYSDYAYIIYPDGEKRLVELPISNSLYYAEKLKIC